MRQSVSLLVAAIAVLAIMPAGGAAQSFQTEKGPVEIETVASGLDHPWSVAFPGDGSMLITERPGRLRRIDSSGRLSGPLAGVPEVVWRGQGGLLDVALDPGFAQNGTVYLSYAEAGEGGAGTAVGRGRLVGERVEDFQVIFRQQPKVSGSNHWGSRLVFAPDGSLFVTLGERQQPDRAQLPNEHLGKIVRIRPDGSVPLDNPFVGTAGWRPEIWSLGHRNMQGAALHPETKRLWIVDHGARGGDEINIPEAGKNYGWPVITYGRAYSGLPIGEGTAKPGMEQPIHYWDPSIAPSGTAFYSGAGRPAWRGNLFVGALVGRMLVRLELAGDRIVHEERMLQGLHERIRDVRQGPDGYLYLLTDDPRGRLLRLKPG
jgi:aldose sugar dehydrogenase